ncbi:RNA-binding domain-containing protein [Companilactobacillus nantensis]|uniref:Uncharacterized protein n=1 Tax=Companilactobacillus nantensis DSM 16982 TaxID=1423774 RepID=A0A0R1WBT9_9LACO|nr:RNA-binding domain-containing protein [Companilactobacillus nantensis]KRM15298.1 hypothetical protein FD31_GL001306 [Companilactobacillus nantensis DSM 16982]GEO64373.1 ATP-dependent DNA helicase RecG [Companilactobacillus nantensis]
MKEIPDNIRNEIEVGKETNSIEFKASQGRDGLGEIPKDVYETVCAFSNRYGGNIYFGVQDDGTLLGISSERIKDMKKNFVTVIQSGQKISPPLYLDIDTYEIDGKNILHVFVPNSSQVHRMNGHIIFDRNNDSDIDITDNTNLVQQMYTRKQSEYTENKIYPYIQIEDFKHELIERIRKVSVNGDGESNLTDKTDLEVLKSLSMYRKDYLTGEVGFTLAGVLTFGKDEVIRGIIPYFAIDVLIRINDTERYDDRLRISTNLIDSYSEIMRFISKHISNPFYMQKDKRVEIRDVLFREIVVNMLVHREYSNPFVSRIDVENKNIVIENANKPVHPGKLKRGEIRPYPKNPNIARIFHMIGLIDEIGSGVGKIFDFAPVLLGGEPIIDNEDHFIVTLPITNKGLSNLSVNSKVKDLDISQYGLTEEQSQVLKILIEPMSTREIYELSDYKNKGNLNSYRKSVLNILLDNGLISRTIPDKPRSPKQKYFKSFRNE